MTSSLITSNSIFSQFLNLSEDELWEMTPDKMMEINTAANQIRGKFRNNPAFLSFLESINNCISVFESIADELQKMITRKIQGGDDFNEEQENFNLEGIYDLSHAYMIDAWRHLHNC